MQFFVVISTPFPRLNKDTYSFIFVSLITLKQTEDTQYLENETDKS
jgi:hypothetical protein